jgi:lipopolysaccharide export system protein LptA
LILPSAMQKYVCLFLLLLTCWSASAQQKVVRLIHADNIFFDQSLIDAQRLVGSVQLEYQGTLFYCDSAYLYSNQNFDAFSRIRVVNSDYNVTGEQLFFDKASNTSRIARNVILRDNEMTLSSDQLHYHLDSEVAYYTTGGKIVSNKNNNVLTSQNGSYSAKTESFSFKKNVVLVNKDYTVKSDTLQYNNRTEVAYFYGPTTIVSKETTIYCENGWYDTKRDISQFNEHAKVTSQKTVLLGDSIYYNGKEGFGEVFRNVSIYDTTSDYIITGNYGRHFEKTKESLVTEKALLTQVFETDTLFVSADTLFSVPDSSELNKISAYHRVRIFKSDLQGLADSLVYSEADSTIRLFTNPILWSDDNQITGDSIHLRTWEGKIDKFVVRGHSLIVSVADTTATPQRFNQIKGRHTVGYFTDNDLRMVRIEGNGQIIYYPADDKDGSSKIIGHNKADCSDIEIEIVENKIKRLRLLKEPNSIFTPLKLTTETDARLEGFLYRGNDRPKSKLDLFTAPASIGE